MPSIRRKGSTLYARFYIGTKQVERRITQHICETPGKRKCNCRGCRGAGEKLKLIEAALNAHQPVDWILNPDAGIHEPEPEPEPEPVKLVSIAIWAHEWNAAREGIVSQNSTRSYKTLINKWILPCFGQAKFDDIRPGDMQRFVAMLNQHLAPSTVRMYVKLLKSVFRAAHEDGQSQRPIPPRATMPKVPRKLPETFEPEEVRAILGWLKDKRPRDVVKIAIAVHCGMRIGEVLNLRWDDFDFRRSVIIVRESKTGEQRQVAIPVALDPWIQFQQDQTLLAGGSLWHNREYTTLLKYAWIPCLRSLGIAYRGIHSTRHTFCCNALDNGMPLPWIRDQVGHSDLSMIMKTYGNRVNTIKGRIELDVSQSSHDEQQGIKARDGAAG